MKTIFNDPIWWAEKAAGSGSGFAIFASGQVIVGAIVGLSNHGQFLALAFAWVVALPLMYLFALRKVIQALKVAQPLVTPHA